MLVVGSYFLSGKLMGARRNSRRSQNSAIRELVVGMARTRHVGATKQVTALLSLDHKT